MWAVLMKTVGLGGIIGLVAGAVLSLLLVIQMGETRHWKKQSANYEQLYHGEKDALEHTVGNYRQAAVLAGAQDRANSEHVQNQQLRISQERTNELESRLSDADARYQRLLAQRKAQAHPGSGDATGVSAAPAAGSEAPDPAGQDGFSDADRWLATRQAIQLDELIKAVRQTMGIDTNGTNAPVAAPDERTDAKPGATLPR